MNGQPNSYLDNYLKKINKDKSLSRLKKERLFFTLLLIFVNVCLIFFIDDAEVIRVAIMTLISYFLISSMQVRYKKKEVSQLEDLAIDSTSSDKKNGISENIIFALFLIFVVPPAVQILLTPNLGQKVKSAWCQLNGGSPVDCIFKR